jgi:hypothetical protein
MLRGSARLWNGHELKVRHRKQNHHESNEEPKQIIYQDLTNTANLTHIWVNHKNGGWGNRVYQILYAVLTHNPDVPAPCFGGDLGHIFASLVENLELCPDDTEEYVSMRGLNSHNHTWHKVGLIVSSENAAMRQYQVLNRSLVEEILGVELMQELPRTCAVHVRFGDHYFRTNHGLSDNRIKECRGANKTVEGNKEECFAHVSGWVQDKCRNYSTIYLATDRTEFTGYLTEQLSQKIVLFASEPNDAVKHLNDMDSFSLDNVRSRAMLQDWLVLSLAKETHAIKSSTFSKTAMLGFYLSPDDSSEPSGTEGMPESTLLDNETSSARISARDVSLEANAQNDLPDQSGRQPEEDTSDSTAFP